MKSHSSFVCQQCGYETPQWYGKCPNCGEWNTLVETVREEGKRQTENGKRGIQSAKPQKLSEVKHIEKNRLKSGYGEFDRVMGGGIVPGSVTLLAGDPGIGKSTLLLHVLSKIGGMYVSGEESAEQVKLRAKRLGIDGANISVFAETNVEGIVSVIPATEPESSGKEDGSRVKPGMTRVPLVIIDSIQTLSSSDLDGMAGSVGQIRRSAELLIAAAKSRSIPILIIGHVTKEGAIAGPKVLEHMVDTVLYIEGERFANARILRTLKNRFGPVEEVGIFEMADEGLKEVDNPSALFLQDRVKNVPGSVVTVIMEGTRPLLVEIQGLAVPSQLAMPRRVGSGVDYNRLQLLVAILQKRLNVPLGTFDIFVNVSGGLKISEPSADLAIALAILSSFKNKALDPKTAVFGEVGLLGEVRSIGSEDRRSKEAKRLGFTTVLSPKIARNLQQVTKYLDG
ncbi:DNA repair protein RadA [Candidatus Gottesmanbacteria bacterium RIFCSPHIGHO2_01_FULL_46_14]|uniref:DNA repair protein RadA n=1 Tax=Candidatus Gottesmanbacteria bacterium RIFCSPHIGHO2_01_FULL_46_14 TaxID=1798380 RepID=A0A1F5ZMG0_9BACT|nr:MAG: DNA repair protein RadA [Candidatus Gottesmanbacteria bacterium RIFCSPHIGHO2_01_FULL_46_14]